jgi:hypothetical protein
VAEQHREPPALGAQTGVVQVLGVGHLDAEHAQPLDAVEERHPQAGRIAFDGQHPHLLEDPAGERGVDLDARPVPRQRVECALLVVDEIDLQPHAEQPAGCRHRGGQPVRRRQLHPFEQSHQCGEGRVAGRGGAERAAVRGPVGTGQLVEAFVHRVREHVALRGGQLRQTVQVGVHLDRVRVAAEREVTQP